MFSANAQSVDLPVPYLPNSSKNNNDKNQKTEKSLAFTQVMSQINKNNEGGALVNQQAFSRHKGAQHHRSAECVAEPPKCHALFCRYLASLSANRRAVCNVGRVDNPPFCSCCDHMGAVWRSVTVSIMKKKKELEQHLRLALCGRTAA
jgi:hypothetical protein